MKYIELTSKAKNLRKIVHLADIHLRLFKRHAEYRETFATLYQTLKKKVGKNSSEWMIVVAGDVVHSKTDLSPEMVDIASEFLSSLADIAPTVVIAGNHDLNLGNLNRLDALSPIVNNIRHPELHYLKNSGIYSIGGLNLAVHSIVDGAPEWPTAADVKGSTKIALFHGPVYSATTDVGYTITNRHHTLDVFDGYDMVLLGDIHKHQTLQEYDPATGKPIVVYSSSLIQQNHGEALRGHGWCEWDIATRTFQFHELPTSYGFYTLDVIDGKVPKYTDMPQNVYLRIFAGNMEQAKITKLVAKIRTERNIIECSISSFSGAKRLTAGATSPTAFLDIHDVDYQNKLITEYLQAAMPELSQDTIDRVMTLNKEKNSELSAEELARNIVWKPLSLKYDNLFTYGESNRINFTNLSGVVGIFAPNATGKTSIAEAICFALFDRTPRTQKAVNIMNTRKDSCFCELTFQLGTEQYVITRKGTRNKKGEVKIDVDFKRLNPDGRTYTSLNGEERRYTNKIITQYVGEFEDFLLTTFSSSSQQGLFVDRGQSDRKDLLSQFMGLNIFDKLHTRANDESKELAGALKRFKNDDFTQALADTQEQIQSLRSGIPAITQSIAELESEIAQVDSQIQYHYERKTPVSKVTDPEVVRREIVAVESQQNDFVATVAAYEQEIVTVTEFLEKARTKMTEFVDVEENYKKFKAVTGDHFRLLQKMDIVIAQQESATTLYHSARGHTYNDQCAVCTKNAEKWIKMAVEAEDKLTTHTVELVKLSIDVEKATIELKLPEFIDIEAKYDKWVKGRAFISTKEARLHELEMGISKIKTKIAECDVRIAKLQQDIHEYTMNESAIKQNALIDEEIWERQSLKRELMNTVAPLRTSLQKQQTDIALLDQRKQDMLKRITEAEELESKYEAYEAYLAAVCRDGLPYKMIADVLPMIETGVNEILAQMVEFTLVFETDGKNINMKIRYDDERSWPSEMASGMEKFLISMAIRVALSSLSSLPKSTYMIIDEGFGTLDPDNMGSVHMMFDVLRTKFDFLLLISHIDAIRDVADTHADIKRDQGFSQIQLD